MKILGLEFNNIRIFLILVTVFSFIGLIILNTISCKNKIKNIEDYIKDANNILNAITGNNTSFVNFANDYVLNRTSYESNIKTYATQSANILTSITNLRDDSKLKSDEIMNSISVMTSINTLSNNLINPSLTAFQNIKDIVNEITPTPGGTPAVTFASNLEAINKNKTDIETKYITMRDYVGMVDKNYKDSSSNQQLISNNLSQAYKVLSDLKTFIVNLINNVKNSSEYVNLQNSKIKAEIMISQLTNIKNSITSTNVYYSQIVNLITSLTNSTQYAQNYLDNILTVFTNATQNAESSLNSSLQTIINNFNSAVSIVGKLNATNSQTPTPFTLPYTVQPLTTGLTIVSIWNKSNEDYKTIVAKYNEFIGYFNSITDIVNSLIDFSNTSVIGNINTNILTVNTKLLEAQNIMKSYFNSSTTPGIIPYTTPVLPGLITKLPTVTPYTYTSI